MEHIDRQPITPSSIATYADGVTLRSGLDSPLKNTDGYGDQPFIQTVAVYNDKEE